MIIFPAADVGDATSSNIAQPYRFSRCQCELSHAGNREVRWQEPLKGDLIPCLFIVVHLSHRYYALVRILAPPLSQVGTGGHTVSGEGRVGDEDGETGIPLWPP